MVATIPEDKVRKCLRFMRGSVAAARRELRAHLDSGEHNRRLKLQSAAGLSAKRRFMARGGMPKTRRICRAMWLW